MDILFINQKKLKKNDLFFVNSSILILIKTKDEKMSTYEELLNDQAYYEIEAYFDNLFLLEKIAKLKEDYKETQNTPKRLWDIYNIARDRKLSFSEFLEMHKELCDFKKKKLKTPKLEEGDKLYLDRRFKDQLLKYFLSCQEKVSNHKKHLIKPFRISKGALSKRRTGLLPLEVDKWLKHIQKEWKMKSEYIPNKGRCYIIFIKKKI